MADLTRYDAWLAWLTGRAEADDDVLICWVDGSAVTGGWDEWSDLDVEVTCRPGTAGATYAAWLSDFREDFPIVDVWELPSSLSPGDSHCFATTQPRPGLLEEATLLLDMHVSDLVGERRTVDVRRHGAPRVLYDPAGLVVHGDEGAEASLAAEAEQVRQRRVTGEWLVNRALRRGEVAEAMELYVRFPLAGVVRLARAEHCPWRHDFGLRYLRRDLPVDLADRLESLVPGATSATLEQLSVACFTWLDELLDGRLDRE